MITRNYRIGVRWWSTAVLALSWTVTTAAEPISFNKDIRPILADRCFTCHGPDSAARKADLRLDLEDAAKALLKDGGGTRAIAPGNAKASEVMHRLLTKDRGDVMPPPKSKLTITKAEIDLIGQWIDQGAKWQNHWAFLPPKQRPAPNLTTKGRVGNLIDGFILQRVQDEMRTQSREADRATLLRRLSFDLTGLPPTLTELDTFAADKSPEAYEKAVDRLLESPAFGERMAVEWLDVARYGDTDGLFEDHARNIYPWRDWVVRAFNSNLAYSDFITWQVAGDLLPDATVEQKIATGFLRNNTTSNEGGIIDEDYRIKYLVDRVNTTATAFLGLTMECAQCHDHKYDPMTQKEYYQFGGFFNSLVGRGNTKGATAPTLKVNTPDAIARLAEIKPLIGRYDAIVNADSAELQAAFADWRKSLQAIAWSDASISEATTTGNGRLTLTGNAISRVSNKADEAPKGEKSTVAGRYVRLELPKDVDQFLTVSEVEVMSNGRNIALQGKAKQSSDYSGGNRAAKALDGDRSGSFGGCACTKSGTGEWWELDLGIVQPIDSVTVWNRNDCCPERLDNVTILILDAKHLEVQRKSFAKAVQQNTWVLNDKAVPLVKDGSKADDTLVLAAPSKPITALRIVPGTSAKPAAGFVLSNISIEIEPAAQGKKKAGNRKVEIAKALATSAAKGHPANDAVKGRKRDTNGWSVQTGEQHLTLFPQKPIMVGAGERLIIKIVQAHRGNKPLLGDYRIGISMDPAASSLRDLTDAAYAAVHKDKPKAPDFNAALEYYRSIYPGFEKQWQARIKIKTEVEQIEKNTVVTMIASDGKMRPNYFLERGEYDKRGDEVRTQAPESVMRYADNLPRNRLGLAQWLTDPENPLTARVAVNRYWQMIFGIGIVKTSEDFGTQGERPTHEELLDTLAVTFVASGWDVKALIKLIVMSATYRQSSIRPPGIDEVDPDNRLLSYAPRRRLQAEFLRDHALMAGGGLVRTIGGPGVNPYQPAVLFGRNAIGNAGFRQSSGDALYRRSLYTYWKRQVPAANMRILGADGRTVCRTRRERTNTPLQAFVMLNDPQFVEAARMIGERMLSAGPDAKARIALAFRLATSRHVKAPELDILLAEYNDRLKAFSADTKMADAYLKVGARPVPKEAPIPELAACSAVASLILNLDESLSRN